MNTMHGGGTGKLSLWWAGSIVVIVTELVLIAALLLRKDADDVPAFERLERSTGVLDDVESSCNTQPVGGGPATVTFCGLELVFRGSLGRVRYPYGKLSHSQAREHKDALLPLRGRMLDLWVLLPEGGGTGRPVIWQLQDDGNAVIPYGEVATYNAQFDRDFGLTFGMPACVLCLLWTVATLWTRWNRPPLSNAADNVRSVEAVEIGFAVAIFLCLAIAIYFGYMREQGGAAIAVMLCTLICLLAWPRRGERTLAS